MSISSDHSRRTILTKFAATHDLASPAVREAFFRAVYGMSSGYDQQQLLVGLVRRVNRLSRDEALGLLASVKAMNSSSNKSAVLVAVADKMGLNDDQVRKAYIDAASTLSSDSDYRNVMSAAIKTPLPKQ